MVCLLFYGRSDWILNQNARVFPQKLDRLPYRALWQMLRICVVQIYYLQS